MHLTRRLPTWFPRLFVLVSLATACSTCVLSRVHAAERATVKHDPEKALERFDEARRLYSQGKYKEAVVKLMQAIALDPAGVELYYNLGVVNEKLQRVDEAIAAYQQYVEMIDDEHEKQRVGKIIKRLQGAKKELAGREMIDVPVRTKTVVIVKEKKVVKTVKVKEPANPGKGRFDGWVIGTGSVAIVAAGVGSYFGYLAMQDSNRNPTTSSQVSYQDLQDRFDRSRREALYSDISFGTAGAFALTSLVLFIARDAPSEPASSESKRSESAVTPTLTTSRAGTMAGLTVSF